MTTEQTQKINKAIDNLGQDPDMRALVQEIESGIKTTKGNYGKYMEILTPHVGSKAMLYVVGQALIKAGADSYGVAWATRILKGDS